MDTSASACASAFDKEFSELQPGRIFIWTLVRKFKQTRIDFSPEDVFFVDRLFGYTSRVESAWETDVEMTDKINEIVERHNLDIVNMESITSYEASLDRVEKVGRCHSPVTLGYKIFLKKQRTLDHRERS